MPQRPEPHPSTRPPDTEAPTAPRGYEDDLVLVRAILQGSNEAWRTFVQRYSGLIYAVIHRYLYAVGPDEGRTVYVDTLASLRRRKLTTYEGRASLSTWLTLVTRTTVLDYLRHRFGRRELPRALRALEESDRRIFHLYYVEGRSFSEVRARLGQNGEAWPIPRLLAALRRIEARLDHRWLQRLSYDLHAQSSGAVSGRLIQYLEHVRREFQENEGARSPEYRLMERETQQTVAQVLAAIARLEPKDQEILTLRFDRGWSARKIAEELGLAGPRVAYTALERIVRRLKRELGGRHTVEREEGGP